MHESENNLKSEKSGIVAMQGSGRAASFVGLCPRGRRSAAPFG